MWLNQKGMETG